MKRNVLALVMPALLVASAANASIEVWNKDGNKLNINGRVYALNYVGDKGNQIDGEADKTTTRLGFTGETQITDALTGYGRAEWEWNTGTNADTETRYAFAGLNFGNAGSIDYGHNDGVLRGITAYTDVLPEFGGNANDYLALGSRTDGVLTYRNSVDGFNFALQYADSGSKKVAFDGLSNKDEAYGFNAQYTIADTGLTIGGGYAQTSGSNDVRYYIGGVNYQFDNLYLGAIYNYAKNDETKVRGFELAAQYGIDVEVGRVTPSVAYIQHREQVDGRSNGNLAKYVEIGATYDINKNLAAVVDYKINLLDSNDAGAKNVNANTKDTIALGLIYQF